MSGVDILATQEVAVEFIFNWTAFWIMFGLSVLVGLIIGIVGVIRDGCDCVLIPAMFALFAVFGGMFGCLMGTGIKTPIAYETQYKVTISEDVHMTDFLEKYEIINTEGKIYTVREVKGE